MNNTLKTAAKIRLFFDIRKRACVFLTFFYIFFSLSLP